MTRRKIISELGCPAFEGQKRSVREVFYFLGFGVGFGFGFTLLHVPIYEGPGNGRVRLLGSFVTTLQDRR